MVFATSMLCTTTLLYSSPIISRELSSNAVTFDAGYLLLSKLDGELEIALLLYGLP